MRSQISSNYLYHFTNNIEILKNILLNGFYARCSIEDYSFIFTEIPKEEAYIGHCMVCFCDIPDELQNHHKNSYGGFGLAMSKKWGIKNGICPVMYIPQNTDSINNIKFMASQIKGFLKFSTNTTIKMNDNAKKSFIVLTEELFGNFNQFIGYLKLYEGKDGSKNTIRYYDEREWRYLIPWTTNEKIKYGYTNILIGKDISNKIKINSLNKEMESFPLRFDVKDIAEIIVPNIQDKQILEKFINISNDLGEKNLNLKESKVLSQEMKELLLNKIWIK